MAARRAEHGQLCSLYSIKGLAIGHMTLLWLEGHLAGGAMPCLLAITKRQRISHASKSGGSRSRFKGMGRMEMASDAPSIISFVIEVCALLPPLLPAQL